MRTFATGATRDADDVKPDYEGFLSPLALIRYGEYMTKHRQTPQGVRASDNWQKGIPRSAYIKSLWRHLVEVWSIHRTPPRRTYRVTPVGELVADLCAWPGDDVALEDALCALIFNAQGYLHEHLRARRDEERHEPYAATFTLPEKQA